MAPHYAPVPVVDLEDGLPEELAGIPHIPDAIDRYWAVDAYNPGPEYYEGYRFTDPYSPFFGAEIRLGMILFPADPIVVTVDYSNYSDTYIGAYQLDPNTLDFQRYLNLNPDKFSRKFNV